MVSFHINSTAAPGSSHDRRNNFDVTNKVRVSSSHDVRSAVRKLFQEVFPDAAFDSIWIAFHDFDRLFDGQMKGYAGCDTVYHDKQHTLDMTLAMARLLAGYETSCPQSDRLGAERAVLGLLTALFHDSGYIRLADESRWKNGAEMTVWHVSRSADFLRSYLPRLDLGGSVPLATQLVHFTGYELNLDEIELNDPRDSTIGHLLGTADLLAQMADRCYLEKCRDRLYAEFVLGGIAAGRVGFGPKPTAYASGMDLLRQTPGFWRDGALQRMDRKFNRAYRYIEPLFGGSNPYMEFIQANLAYLGYVIEHEDWQSLRRQPDCFTARSDTMQSVTAWVSRRLAESQAPAGLPA